MVLLEDEASVFETWLERRVRFAVCRFWQVHRGLVIAMFWLLIFVAVNMY
jgi:hypothetical protein